MHLCVFSGLSNAYFSANRMNFPHIDNCSYGTSNSFNFNNTDETKFDFQSALKKMMMQTTSFKKTRKLSNTSKSTPTNKKSKLNSLWTINQIYNMCISFPCNHSYNGQIIGQILLDDRSEYMYPYGVFGNRIIKSTVKAGYFYNFKKHKIHLVAPSSKKYEFILKIQDSKLFQFIRNSLYNNRDKFILVAGNWKRSGKFNVFQADITGKRQVKVMNIDSSS